METPNNSIPENRWKIMGEIEDRSTPVRQNTMKCPIESSHLEGFGTRDVLTIVKES